MRNCEVRSQTVGERDMVTIYISIEASALTAVVRLLLLALRFLGKESSFTLSRYFHWTADLFLEDPEFIFNRIKLKWPENNADIPGTNTKS